MSSSPLIITEDDGRKNMFAREPRLQPQENYINYSVDAEKTNGRWAMIGFIACIGAYTTRGQILPGIF